MQTAVPGRRGASGSLWGRDRAAEDRNLPSGGRERGGSGFTHAQERAALSWWEGQRQQLRPSSPSSAPHHPDASWAQRGCRASSHCSSLQQEHQGRLRAGHRACSQEPVPFCLRGALCPATGTRLFLASPAWPGAVPPAEVTRTNLVCDRGHGGGGEWGRGTDTGWAEEGRRPAPPTPGSPLCAQVSMSYESDRGPHGGLDSWRRGETTLSHARAPFSETVSSVFVLNQQQHLCSLLLRVIPELERRRRGDSRTHGCSTAWGAAWPGVQHSMGCSTAWSAAGFPVTLRPAAHRRAPPAGFCVGGW